MIENKLQLNDEKTECHLKRLNKRTQNFMCTSLPFEIMSYNSMLLQKNLGFNFTCDMRHDVHVQDIYRKDYIDIRRISSIRHRLSIDATKTLLSAFVLPKLHYCNSLFCGSPIYILERLQKVHGSNTNFLMSQAKSHFTPSHVST